MARIVAHGTVEDDSASVSSWDLSENISFESTIGDDYYIWCTSDGVNTFSISGYTTVSSYGATGHSAYLFYKRTTGTNEALPTVTNTASTEVGIVAIHVEGGHASTAYANLTENSGNTATPTWSAQTVGTADSLVMYFGGMDVDPINTAPETYPIDTTDVGSTSHTTSWILEKASGTVASKVGSTANGLPDNWRCVSIEVLDDAVTSTLPICYFDLFPAISYATDYTETNTQIDYFKTAGVLPDGTSADTLTFDSSTVITGTTNYISGTATTFLDAENNTVLTHTGQGWTTDAYQGMILTINSTLKYVILSNTSDTITARGDMGDLTTPSYSVDEGGVITTNETIDDSHDARLFYVDEGAGTLPTGLVEGYYFLTKVTATTCILSNPESGTEYYQSTDGIDALTFSAAGTGTISLIESGMLDTEIDTAHINNERAGNGWRGKNYEYPSAKDLSSSTISYTIDGAGGNPSEAFLTLIDTAGDFKIYKIKGADEILVSEIGLIDVANTTKEVYEGGTFDDTIVEGFYMCCRNTLNTVEQLLEMPLYGELNSLYITEGTSSEPCTWQDAYDLLQTVKTGTSFRQSAGQIAFLHDISIGGDGTNDVYFDDSGISIAQPAPSDGTTTFRYYAPNLGFAVYGSASSTVNLPQHHMYSGTDAAFTVNASDAAEPNIDGSLYINKIVSVNSDDSITGTVFSGGYLAAYNDATITSCTFKATSQATGFLLLSTTHDFNACTLRDCTDGMEIDTAGNYDVSEFTFINNTNDINVTETTGTVNITLGEGQSTPTHTTDGATVNFLSPTLSADISGIIAGSRLQIYNVTAAAEVVNAINAGTTYSDTYTEGGDYTEGDTVRIRLTYQSGVNAYKEFTTNVIATASGWSSLASQVVDDVYEEYGVDGSTITEFSWDNPNLEIDINDSDNTTVIQRVGAWYSYYIFTSDGIANLFGCIDWESINSIKIDQSMCDLLIDNTKAAALILTGGRIYRIDGTTVISATSNSIHIDYDPVYNISTGVSGLTAAESAQLAVIDDVDTAVDLIPTNPLLTTDSRIDYIATIPDNPLLTTDSRIDYIATIPDNPLLTTDSRIDYIATIPDNPLLTTDSRIDYLATIPDNPLLTTDARLDNLDATISSRGTFTSTNEDIATAVWDKNI